ncbi:MAG: VOC family protein [Ruminococcus sp.]|nr:VOC family protein [Ruminococcus sp.]
MKIEHIAIWVKVLDVSADFYAKFFGAKIGPLYHNPKTNFSSRFITFESGARLEIMTRPDIIENAVNNAFGYTHITLSVGSTDEVDRLTTFLGENGVTILSQPRTTGDGYYESKIADPDGNEIEITV